MLLEDAWGPGNNTGRRPVAEIDYRRPITGGLSASDKGSGVLLFLQAVQKMLGGALKARHHARGNIFYGSAAIE